ncbi:MAG TPA: RNA methyltransferase [Thermoanaerobaculia bacterium]
MITSRSNAWFKRVRDALRRHADEIVIEGPKAVADAIAAGWKPIAMPQFSPALLKSISDTKTSRGVIGLFQRPEWKADEIFAREDTVVIALDGIQDPGNVGTIVRLAAAFDAAGVILLPGCADPYGPKAIRASAGAVLSVPIVQMENLRAVRQPLFVADSRGSTKAPPARGAVLVFGSEGQGVSKEVRDMATPIAIETSGKVESLNVAGAAAILLWRSYVQRLECGGLPPL